MPIIKRQIILEVEANASAVNDHEQGGDLERRFLEEQLQKPVVQALERFHAASLTAPNFHTDLVRL